MRPPEFTRTTAGRKTLRDGELTNLGFLEDEQRGPTLVLLRRHKGNTDVNTELKVDFSQVFTPVQVRVCARVNILQQMC